VSAVKMGAIEMLSKLGVSAKPGKVIGIYGYSMIGKSAFAAISCREYVGEKGMGIIFGTEAHYADDDYREMIRRLLPESNYINYCPSPEDLFGKMNLVAERRFEGRLCLILDSLSNLALHMTADLYSRGITDIRVISARIIPVVDSAAQMFKILAVEKAALGLVVMHASSTAGTSLFRNLVPTRPSMSARVAHSLDYLLFMESEGGSIASPRKLTPVMSRLSPVDEGKSVRFKFSEKSVAWLPEEGGPQGSAAP